MLGVCVFGKKKKGIMMVTFPEYTSEHVLVRLEERANGDQLWGCGECGHTRLINFDPPPAHRNELVQRGNDFARHSMGSSCSPELDAAVQLRLTAHPTPVPEGTMQQPSESRVYGSCGIRRKSG